MRLAVAVAVFLAVLPLYAEPRLVEPRDGAELAGGSIVAIAWDGEVDAGVEEWEAFLSVDGGHWFSTRITPHLDADIRRFTFEVPNVDARDVSILLRFGDEEHEREVDVPARFTIRFDPAAMRTRVFVVRGDGEPARPGSRGVARWVTGARDGSGLQTVSRREVAFSEPVVVAVRVAFPEVAESEDGEFALATRTLVAASNIEPRERDRTRAIPHTSDLLLATRRLNL